MSGVSLTAMSENRQYYALGLDKLEGMNTQLLHHDFELCYRAICSRDSRFDGRFFTAVTSTGIYCRPICPARTPYAQNVRFYPTAAAAQAAGFRACRRCRPEASPGSADWNSRVDLVARALRLIAEGTVDTEGVGGLARRLSVSERHLHREFLGEVGAGPLALARTRRAQTARLLIDQTDLTLTTIAFAAGFASIRQFNETMFAAFGCPPGELRCRDRMGAGSGAGAVVLRLQYRPPFAHSELLAFLGSRTVPGVEEVVKGLYRRTMKMPRAVGIIELEPLPGSNFVQLQLHFEDLSDLGQLVRRSRQLFDLDADPGVIDGVLGADLLLAPLVQARPGLRVPGTVDGFELAVRAVLGQQISVAGARTLTGRLVQALGEPLARPVGSLTHCFPDPEALLRAGEQELCRHGLTRTRANALLSLARAVTEESLCLERSADWNETAGRLNRLPGIGPWTVAYIAMRALGDPDAFPAGDLALRRVLEHSGVSAKPVRSIANRAEIWRPWRAYAAHHLWASCKDQSAAKHTDCKE